ncbi:MAG: T9SS type A sorting domain-containing protein [Ignavibacterium album]|nr:T9SS type A sorting domain-containing protein [Ignavibacterium album]MBI5661986.1 T9SS type A sorting domain-containing protein [Ignavibacterium album]
MKLINLLNLLLILLIIIPTYGQDNSDYFPYKKNNYWEYLWLETGYPDTIVSLSVFDSVDNEGQKIAIFDSYFINPIKPPVMLPDSGIYIIDSSLNVFTNAEPIGYQEYALIYKLNGIQGEQWVMYDYSHSGNGPFEIARIKEISDATLFGIKTKLMWIDYFYAPDSTDTTGLGRGGDVLAKGFGLQARQREGWPGIGLRGAVIDGVLYGDTTTVGVNEPTSQNHPLSFELYQNYPNPFNPVTVITFSLSSGGNISLIVYDLLGNEVIRLIDNIYYQSGKYEKSWNSNDTDGELLSSGIYFYRLSFNNHSITKSMILIK